MLHSGFCAASACGPSALGNRGIGKGFACIRRLYCVARIQGFPLSRGECRNAGHRRSTATFIVIQGKGAFSQCVRHRNVRQSYVAGVGYCHLIRENIAYLDLKPLVLDPFHRLAIACDGIKAFFHRQGRRILGGMERYDMVIIWIQLGEVGFG